MHHVVSAKVSGKIREACFLWGRLIYSKEYWCQVASMIEANILIQKTHMLDPKVVFVIGMIHLGKTVLMVPPWIKFTNSRCQVGFD